MNEPSSCGPFKTSTPAQRAGKRYCHLARRSHMLASLRRSVARFCLCAAVAAGSLAPVAAQAPNALAARVQTLEDREAIRALLVSYAHTLDTRDFDGFEQLWAKDAEFIGGAGNNAKG